MALPAGMAATAARRVAAGITEGTLVVGGDAGGWTAGHGPPEIGITVHDRRAFGAVLGRGSVGLAQSYVDGWWDADDLTGVIRLLLQNLAGPLEALDRLGRVWSRPLSVLRASRAPTAQADRRNVQAHYDLPGALFAAMLDPTMTYSCGVFQHPNDSLEAAQRAKLDRICTKLGLGPEDNVLEIGTGWGGFALHAAASYGCTVTTTTISDAQGQVARERVAQAGLDSKVTVLGLDYRELEGTFDKVVSVEMIEAVDWRRHREFFATCRRLLRPEGLLFLQAIVIADASYERAKHHRDFIRSMVFPGGCIPSVTAITDAVTAATDLRLVDLEDIGRHYAPTLRHWDKNLDQQWDLAVAAGLDDRFRRLFHLYLCYCEAAFLERHISDVQMILAGPDWRAPLATRSC